MSSTSPSHLVGPINDTLIAGYEELRRQALDGYRGPGLAFLLRHGMKTWMETCSDSAATVPAPAQECISREVVIPTGARAEFVVLLAGMILHNHTEGRT